jgi:hypothetical protein
MWSIITFGPSRIRRLAVIRQGKSALSIVFDSDMLVKGAKPRIDMLERQTMDFNISGVKRYTFF